MPGNRAIASIWKRERTMHEILAGELARVVRVVLGVIGLVIVGRFILKILLPKGLFEWLSSLFYFLVFAAAGTYVVLEMKDIGPMFWVIVVFLFGSAAFCLLCAVSVFVPVPARESEGEAQQDAEGGVSHRGPVEGNPTGGSDLRLARQPAPEKRALPRSDPGHKADSPSRTVVDPGTGIVIEIDDESGS
jgi:hypothetical protein